MVLNIKRMLYRRELTFYMWILSRYRRECFFVDFKWKKYLPCINIFRRNFIVRMNIDYRTISLRKLNSIVADNRFEFRCFLSEKNDPKKHACSRKLVWCHVKIYKEILFHRIWKDSVCICGCTHPSHVMENRSTSRQ